MDAIKTGLLNGFDCSHYNPTVDFELAKSRGMRFAYIKAADGKYETNYWRLNWGKSQFILPRGAYVWLHNRNIYPIADQVGKWLELLTPDPGELPIAIDFEETAKGNPTADDLYNAMLQWEAGTGRTGLIYTRANFWQDHGMDDAFFGRWGLWVAQYKISQPDIPAPWNRHTFWQWSQEGDGQVYGYGSDSKEMDMDVFNGSEADFANYLGGVVTPPTGVIMRYDITPKSSKVNLRADHSTASADVGDLLVGQHAQGDELWSAAGEQWLHALEVNGAAKDCWIAVIYGGSTLCTLVDTAPPPAGNIAVGVSVDGASVFSASYPAGSQIAISVS